jgi:hypothetical protein
VSKTTRIYVSVNIQVQDTRKVKVDRHSVRHSESIETSNIEKRNENKSTGCINY